MQSREGSAGIAGRAHPLSLILFIIALGICAPGCSSTSETQGAGYSRNPRAVRGTASVVFASDTQSPLWVETILLESDDNERATRTIFEAVARETTCAAMFHLGDITPLGGVSTYWEEFDRSSRPIRDARIPLYPAFGNHEYMPWAEDGISNMVWRFPFLTTSWYVRKIGPLAVVILNSNFSQLSENEKTEQGRWYAQALRDLDDDTTVSAVIVGCHHSPYTNSTIVDPSGEVLQAFVPPFVKSRKAGLFMSGHAHALEHFTLDGKDFMVIGGGGGLLHPLLQEGEQRWPDRVARGTNRSFFHYVRITPHPDRTAVDVYMLSPDFDGFRPAYSFELPSDDAN